MMLHLNFDMKGQIMKKGIDISYCQQNVDFEKVRNSGIDFVIIRTGYLGKTDSRFHEHMKGALKAGLDVGAYCYQTAKTVDEARKEAEETVSAIGEYPLTYPVFLDIEDLRLLCLTNELRTEIAVAFLETVRKHNFYPAIYANPAWLKNYLCMDKLKRYDIWLASWTDDPLRETRHKLGQTVWQWGLDEVNGVENKVDGDVCYVDYPKKIKAKCLCGKERVVLTKSAFIHTQPHGKSPSLARCRNGEVLTALRGRDMNSGGTVWRKVMKGDSFGWIRADLSNKISF